MVVQVGQILHLRMSDVTSLQNNDKYGVMIGNCCQSNKFDVNVCFGEKLLRENGKGGI